MSAPLLNFAAQPGAQSVANQSVANPSGANQPGAGQGIAAQAQQTQGPVAGFEALLAALFGDQAVGVVDPNAAATTAATAGKTPGKSLPGGKITLDGGKGQAKADDAKGAATTTATAGLVPDATLALAIPAPTAATTVAATATAAPAATGAGTGGASGQAATAGLTDKTATAADALAKLAGAAAAAATDPGAAKDAAAVGTDPAALATAKAGQTPQAAKSDLAPTPAPQSLAAPPPVTGPVAQSMVATALPQTLPPPAQTAPVAQAKAAEPTQTAGAKDKTVTAKSGRVEGARADAGPAAPAAAKAGSTNVALAAASAGKDASNQEPALSPASPDAKPQTGDTATPATNFATASTTTPATLLHAAAVAVRGAPQTVANLAGQIAKKLDGRSTRFDVQLDPAGLGKVDVRMEIAASGKMSAAMTFDTPQAAAELRARAGELQKALEQAGFDLTGGMSFDVAADRGQGGRGQEQGADNAPQFRGRAFQTALDTSSDVGAATQLTFRRGSPAGVDVRI